MAISEQTGLPGDRYLEKIIQVSFELPRPDRIALRQALSKRLDLVMADTPNGYFDKTYWGNIFRSGIDPLIKVPRDVVRLINALSVTYPAVIGEVNPVDFIAIEALRIFQPGVYDVIRNSPNQFIDHLTLGGLGAGDEKKRAEAFHESWLKNVEEPLQLPLKEMLGRLFPRLKSVWKNMHYSAYSAAEFRRQLRICAPEVFPTYFKLSLSPDTVSRADIDALLESRQSSESFANYLEIAAGVKRLDGVSKASVLLERFMDHVEKDVDVDDVQSIIEALFSVGDKLLSRTDHEPSMFVESNETLIGRITYHVLQKVEPTHRCQLLKRALDNGNALRCCQYLLTTLAKEAVRAEKTGEEVMLTNDETLLLKKHWCLRTKQLASDPNFIDHPSVAWLVTAWREWGNADEAVSWWRNAAVSDEGLLKLIAGQAVESKTQSSSDIVWRTHLNIDPRDLEPYGDIQTLAERVQLLLSNGVEKPYQAAAEQFVLKYEQMKNGKMPNKFGEIPD